jgi:hypothetical protein
MALVRTIGRGKYFGVGEISSGRYLWYATKNRALQEPEPGGRKTTVLRHFASWHSPIPDLVEATPDDQILLHPIYKMEPLTTWTRDRASLVGDAAHPIEPSLGMGACLAIEDALILGVCLERATRLEDALALYEPTRRPRVDRMVRWSKWLASSEQIEHPAVCTLRDLGTRLSPSRSPDTWPTARSTLPRPEELGHIFVTHLPWNGGEGNLRKEPFVKRSMNALIRPLATIAIAAFCACGSPEEVGSPGAGGGGASPDAPVSSTPQPGGSNHQPRRRQVAPRSGMADVHPIRWQSIRKVNGRALLVRFTSGVEPCYVLDHVDVEYGSRHVAITLFEGHDPESDNVACIEIAELKQVRVELAEALDGRRVIDGAR